MLNEIEADSLRRRRPPWRVDSERAAAVGYCFAGSAVLELARADAPLDGFATFHGGLATPESEDYSRMQAPLLILHGWAPTRSCR